MTNFNRTQLNTLSDLSRSLFGAPDSWRRFLKMRQFDSVASRKVPVYITRPNGQVARLDTAISNGWASPLDKDGNVLPLFEEKGHVVTRTPTFEEIRDGLLMAVETKEFSSLPPAHVNLLAATKFTKGELLNIPWLVVTETQERDYTDLVALLTPELAEKVKDRKVPQGNTSVFCLDGFQFMSDVVFVLNHPEQAAEALTAYQQAQYAVPLGVVGVLGHSDISDKEVLDATRSANS
jgi:hypothetical protein